ncbi:sulfur transfer protein SirA [Enhygromyxa salina]|uniref:Sulfur transfer protein SirA n=2 Tax=Enhygromyxa salina TaxID=215803 RepID=A0A2S9YDD9_9BACT|nr:sulfur transfer protein SirA [Enhygromyxa salina]
MKCPAPVIRVAREAALLRSSGGFLVIRADDPAFRPDIEAWVRSSGAQLLELEDEGGGVVRACVRVGEVERQGSAPAARSSEIFLDLRGAQCPGPVIALAKLAARHPAGTEVRVIADDPAFALDLRSWVQSGRAELLSLDDSKPEIEARLRIAVAPGAAPTAMPATVPVSAGPSVGPSASPTTQPMTALASQPSPEASTPATPKRCTLLVLHNDHEALLAALLVANGAAAQGMETSLFFTFWGLNLLRGDHPDPTQPRERVSFLQRLMKWMMPKGPTRQKLGQMHFAGVGKGMLSSIMRSQNILGLPELMRSAQDLGVGFTACTMSMSVMGITTRDLYPYPNLEFAGVATFVERAKNSSLSLVF